MAFRLAARVFFALFTTPPLPPVQAGQSKITVGCVGQVGAGMAQALAARIAAWA